MDTDYIVILDAGAQYGKVIDRRVRELLVATAIMPLDTPVATLRADPHLKGVIISGGPSSVYAADAPKYDPDLFTLALPILGICYGMQMMNRQHGGTVERLAQREDGQDDVWIDETSPLFAGLKTPQAVLLTHGDSVGTPAPAFTVIAKSGAIVAGIEWRERNFYGVQFHPEVDLSVQGIDMLRNFVSGICKMTPSFTMEDREAKAVAYIRGMVGTEKKVLCLVSGGVDSSVCAALLSKAISPDRIVCVHIDHGFMRLNESALVMKSLEPLGLTVHIASVFEEFLNAVTDIPPKGGAALVRTKPLRETVNPEEKRKIIGDEFMRVSQREIEKLGLDAANLLLAQGTLRPDLIESANASMASSKAEAIKTHHNDTHLVRQLRAQGLVIEPLADYHKDEVRILGRALGLPEALVIRQPFPGPGLAIRIVCCDDPFMCAQFDATQERVAAIVAGAYDHALVSNHRAELSAAVLTASLLPIRTVGVQGDGRSYSYAVAVTSPKATTRWEILMLVAKIIPKLCHNVNRVAFMFGSPVAVAQRTVTPTRLTLEVLDKLRAADDAVNTVLLANGLMRKLSQVPVVLLPVDFSGEGRAHSVVVRTFITNDFMTGVPAVPGSDYMPVAVLSEIVARVSAVPGVSRVLYDLTSKPPGTTEWE